MPKRPGTKSTRKTYGGDISGLEVASFIMQHEEWLWRRPCVIRGCDHRMGPKTDEPNWAVNWKSCDENQLPAYIVETGNYDEAVGIACPCHVQAILTNNQ